MKAVLLKAVGQLTMVEAERPVPDGRDEVLIRIAAVGVCGSEIHAFKGTHPFRKPPSILGHEVTGQVVEVGADVHGISPGDRVFVDPQWTCGECKWCRSGRHNMCHAKKVLGTVGWSGGMGEYIVAPAQSVYHLPGHVSHVAGTLIEPLSVAVHQVNSAEVRDGESIVVLGTGPIGMMVAAMARVRGASPIIAVDIQEHCLEVAQKSFGATHGMLAGQEAIADRVLGITGGRCVDVVFLTVGVSSLVQEALDMVEPEGRIVFVALFEDHIQLDVNDVIHKHLTLAGSSMYNAQDIMSAIDLISSGRVRAEAMVTHVLPLEEAQHGFHLASTKEDGAIKVILEH